MGSCAMFTLDFRWDIHLSSLSSQLLFYLPPLSPTIVVVVVPAKKRNALRWHEFNSFRISSLPRP